MILSIFNQKIIRTNIVSKINLQIFLKKISILDDNLQPGLVKRYFKNDSLVDLLDQLKRLI